MGNKEKKGKRDAQALLMLIPTPRVGLARVGSGQRVRPDRIGWGRVGAGHIGPVRFGSVRVRLGWIGSGRGGIPPCTRQPPSPADAGQVWATAAAWHRARVLSLSRGPVWPNNPSTPSTAEVLPKHWASRQ
eukprot:gene12904-biopygen14058